jgi:hypothetical protein
MESSAISNLLRSVDMAVLKGMSEREQRHNTALARYWGLQYSDLAKWDDNTKPMDSRAPRIVWRVEALLVDTINDYLFGDMRAPTFGVEGGTLNEADHERLTARAAEIYTASGLLEGLSEVGRLGLVTSSVAVAFYYAHDGGDAVGRFYAEVLQTGGCMPKFGRDDRAAARAAKIDYDDLLELDERWSVAVPVPGEESKSELMHYRRLWTTTQTIEYMPKKDADVATGKWTENKKATPPPHNLGFVPVEWIPNGGFVTGDADGFHLIDPADYALADSINYTMSQVDRAIKYNQDPWLAFTNAEVEADKLKKGGGRTLDVRGKPGATLPADAKLLEMSGAGQTVAMGFVQQARTLLTQTARVVLHNPDQWSGALSGVALERLLAPMLTMVSRLRMVYGRRLSRFVLKMLAAELGGMEALSGAQVVAKWGPLIEPNDADAAVALGNAITAVDAGLLTFDRAVAHVAPYFGVESAGALLAELLAEGTGRTPAPADGAPTPPATPPATPPVP